MGDTLFDIHDDFVTGALFSPCENYRYALWRRWNWSGPEKQVMFVGLNPSTADETKNDPTIRRCINFCKDWGYGALIMMNAYGFRATDPKVMKAADEPIGPGNNAELTKRALEVGLVIAAWGTNCPDDREEQVCQLINRDIHCLEFTKHGQPRHPLYVKGEEKPKLFWTPKNGFTKSRG